MTFLQKIEWIQDFFVFSSAVRVCEGEEAVASVSVSEAGTGWRQRGWGLLWSQGSGEGAQLSQREREGKKKTDKKYQPAAGLRERNPQTRNPLPSTVRNTKRKNLRRYKLYNLMNVCLDSFMMKVNVGVPRPAWDGFYCSTNNSWINTAEILTAVVWEWLKQLRDSSSSK